jgi:putative transcriptional regulator
MRKMYCRLAVLMAEKDPRLTQRRLSKETKLSVTTVNRLHNNDFERVDTATINTLCNYFGCDVGELFVMREAKASERDRSLAGTGAS